MKQKKQTIIIFFLAFAVFFLANPIFAEEQVPKSATKENLFSGFTFKLGKMTSPKVGSFSDKWIASISFDKMIKPYLAWGLEFQPYFRSMKGTDFKFTNIVGNLFLNVKAGYHVGQLIKIKALKFLKPLKMYGGLGAGAELSNASVKIEGESFNDFNLRFAWHMIFGAEYPLSKISIILEYQPVKVINPNLEPSTVKSNYWMIGIRF